MDARARRTMISVIIPYFNSEKTVARALESVVRQTFDGYEIIAIDDGSTDRTHRIVDEFFEKNAGVRFQHVFQKNQGPSEARNLGISKAKGKYLAFLDSDDYWVNSKLETQINLMNEMQIDLLGSNITMVGTNGKISRKYFVKRKIEYVSYRKLLFKHYFYTSSVMVRKKILAAAGGFPEKQKYAEDTLAFARVARNHKSAVSRDFLVRIDKPMFGESGLSANLAETHRFILRNITTLKREDKDSAGKVGGLLYDLATWFALLKYLRRCVISIWNRKRHGGMRRHE